MRLVLLLSLCTVWKLTVFPTFRKYMLILKVEAAAYGNFCKTAHFLLVLRPNSNVNIFYRHSTVTLSCIIINLPVALACLFRRTRHGALPGTCGVISWSTHVVFRVMWITSVSSRIASNSFSGRGKVRDLRREQSERESTKEGGALERRKCCGDYKIAGGHNGTFPE